MNRDQALRKIPACLRMAGSSNPTESATALRQARALMGRGDRLSIAVSGSHAAQLELL
ncbi:DUF2786 domain-containing protein [Pseudoxanthomonas sp. UTMC 1351]|uniref:DUF2786 domain-containing protein n=1 Tax=Pseudoxanthomonas sp. UTMC 1351 TaxID=2695853 RepID=UPI0034CF78A2